MMEMKQIDIFIFIFIIGVVTLCVRGQVPGPVVCRASFNCAGGPGDDLGVAVDGAGCCLGNPSALAYTPQSSEDCIACVVVGFLVPSFSGQEQGPGHSVPVGYLKGGTIAGQNLVFDVRSTQGTAREGSQFDYTVNTLRARALANGAISNVVLTFRVDSIAQEPNETFTLTLDPLVQPNPREGLFFRNTIEVSIVDNERIQFSFTETSYRAIEPDSSNPTTFLPVLVSKSTRIASRVELVVVPLTVDEARATSLPLPSDIPRNDSRSPPFANSADFNNANITLVFEPDEDAEVNEKSAPIFVTDDAINEATEQVFVAELILASSLDPAPVDLTRRPSTLCRIIDNDPIRIGFELPSYTYMEPPEFDEFLDQFYVSPTGRPENGPIFLAKENNVTSEQTFLVSFQVTDSAPSGTQSATIDQDYRFAGAGQTSQTEFFFPNQQMILFLFELRFDTFPEGTEAFQASVSPEDTREFIDENGMMVEETFPTSLNPEVLAPDIFITILDDDPIIIGFTNTSYTVDEDIGTLQVDVRVLNPPDDQPLPASVDLVIQSVSGSAIGGSDFNITENLFLILDDANRQHSFTVTIIDDIIFEFDESFSLELRFDPNALDPPPSNVILCPNTTTVDIIDNEALEVVIGFLNTSYTVNKDDGLVNIQVGIINEGILRTSVTVIFFISQNQSLMDGVLRIDTDLVLSFTTPIIDLSVAITDYLSEFSESVVANIDFMGDPITGVTLDPANASINIDVPIIGFDDTEYSVSEAGDSAILTVRIRGGGNQCNKTEWALNYTVRDVSAQPSEDYTATNLERIIYVSESQPASVMIPIIDDNVLELNETFRVEIGIVNDEDRTCVTLQPNVVNVVTVDDDIAVIGLSVSDNGTASEGMDRPLNLTVAVTFGELGVDVEMELVLLPEGTAKSGSDFLINGGQIFTLGPNTGSHMISIDIINDTMFEAEVENFAIRLCTLNATGLHGLELGTQQADLTIQDDDYVTIGFNSTTYNVRESNVSVPLQIDLLNGEFDNNVAVSVGLNTVDGSAKSTSDFENETSPLIFSRVETVQTVNLNIIDDNVFEADEIFMAVLELANDSRIILQPSRTNISIIMDDDTVMIGFTYENYTVAEKDIFTDITVDLKMEAVIEQNVIVRVSTQASDSGKGGEDFDTITDHQLTFIPGVTSLSVPINIISDGDFEETENFFIILSVLNFPLQLNTGTPINLRQNLCQGKNFFSINSQSDDDKQISIDLDRVFVSRAGNDISFSLAAVESERVGVSPARANVTILDNDTITIGFSMSSYSVNECEGQVSIAVVVKGSLKRTVALHLNTSDLTANAGVNYGELTNYSLIFNDSQTEGERTVNISINATNETNFEVDEEFIVTLFFPESEQPIPRVTLEPYNATIAIHEINGRIGFIPDTETDSIVKVVDEDVGAVNLTVGLMGSICGEIEIEFQVSNNRSFTATDGKDYTIAMERRLILTTESPNATITIDIVDDGFFELDEFFLVSLSFKDQVMIPRVTLVPRFANITIRASDPLPETSPVQSTDTTVPIIGGTLGAISVLLISGIILLIIFLLWLNKRTALKKLSEGAEDAIGLDRAGFSVQSSYKLKLPPHLIIHANNLKMTETIGQGEFGVVYKGHILEDGGKIVTATVAIKTLKGFYDSATIRDMLKECSKMCEFDHPNVLTLNGVCLDGGPAPFIIMPFMTNGSLLAYLRKNRATLVIESGNRQPEDDNEENVRKQLMDMCLQVARGMEYLAKMKVVHRDLAARNCMIDMSYVIKVADFGLAESVGTKDYFRQDKSAAVKLPLKWLAPESLEDYIFSEKSDVWAYGVTSWEIFTAGKVPYTTVNLNDLPNMLHNGYRLEKPINEACDSEMYMLMQHCWELDPTSRPSFSDLVSSLSQSLEAMAGYMDVGAFGQLQVHESALESAPGEIQEQRQPEKESKEDEVVEVKSKETSM